jgi:hypothetical protein
MEILINGTQDSLTPVGISALGTPVFDNVVFPAGNYFDLSGNQKNFEQVSLDAVQLVVNRPKKIVKSEISGRDGEISEHVGFANYQIALTAVIAPDPSNPSENTELLNRLKKLDDVPERVQILSKHLNNIFKITHVIIEDMRVQKIDADTYSVVMPMYEDKDIDLKDFG